jgi:hypothetical protein
MSPVRCGGVMWMTTPRRPGCGVNKHGVGAGPLAASMGKGWEETIHFLCMPARCS